MPEAMTELSYIRQQMADLPNAAFIPDWKKLTTQDKKDLVDWATIEMNILGIPIKPPPGN